MRHASLTSLSLIGAVAAVAVAGSASATTVNFATAPTVGTYATSGTSAWVASAGAWGLSAPVSGGISTFDIAAPAGLTLGNAYASGSAQYATTSSVPAPFESISPVFAFSVSLNGGAAQVTIGGVGGIYALGSSNAYDAVRAREAFGFQLGANAGSAIVQVLGNRSGLAAGFATLGGTTTWDQLMAATTAGGQTWGSLTMSAVSVACSGAPGSYDPLTAGNDTSVLVQQFSVVPAPGALALLGVVGLAGGRRRRA